MPSVHHVNGVETETRCRAYINAPAGRSLKAHRIFHVYFAWVMMHSELGIFDAFVKLKSKIVMQ